jgi:acyl carrier protein
VDLLAELTTLVTRELDLPETPPPGIRLLDEAGLDSAGLLALAFAIEREFGVELEEEEFTRANFESIDSIARLILRRLSA